MIILGLLLLILGVCQLLEYYCKTGEAHYFYLGIVLTMGGSLISISAFANILKATNGS